MMRAFRYRLYPTPEQAEAFERWAGCARAIYNAGLEQRNMAYRMTGASPGYYAQTTGLGELKAAMPWLAEPHSDVLLAALHDLHDAFRNFFERRAAFPRYRSRRQQHGFRLRARDNTLRVRRVSRHWGEIRVPKLGWVRFRWSRAPEGDIRHATVRRDALGWHVAIVCDVAHDLSAAPTGTAVGIDRGVAVTVATSNGTLLRGPGLAPGQRRRALVLARRLNRQQRGSRRREQTRVRLAKLRAKDARVRKDFLHKLTTDLAKNHGLVAIENLRVGNMTRRGRGKRGLNRAILAQGWGDLERFLAYKLEDRGGTLVKVPAAYTSRACSSCGLIDARSRTSQAEFCCVGCGHAENADINAARNILAAGLAVTARGGPSVRAAEPRTVMRAVPVEANREQPGGAMREITVVAVESLTAICSDCGQGLWGGPPCEHKLKRAAEREAEFASNPTQGGEG